MDFIMPFDIGCYRKCSHALESMVNNPGEGRDNPWGFYAEMWHFTKDGRIFHDDELEFKK